VRIDLCAIGAASPLAWTLGESRAAAARVVEVAAALDALAAGPADAVLLWDAALGSPPLAEIRRLAAAVADVHHAGLALGTGGLPGIVDFVHPTWMLGRDADASIESTSWRVTWRACLVRAELVRQLGGLAPGYDSLDAAALDAGYRWIRRGAFVRHVPSLAAGGAARAAALSVHDELRFARTHFGEFWTRWSIGRAIATGHLRAAEVARAWPSVRAASPLGQKTYQRPPAPDADLGAGARVSVLVPTIERYPYLRVLLEQLRAQTVRPHEILVIDQTPVAERDAAIARDFADLPIRLFHQDAPGQCTSRNFGLRQATGDHVLFIDDDDEVPPTLIERHLRTLARFDVDVSCGVADEVGAGEQPEDFRHMRVSDTFPTNNTMVRIDRLRRSGLFDLAYDRMPRADHDLGMRVYLSGALMVLDPDNHVLHHHAPRGGLRTHKARVVTYAASRQQLTRRHLPAASEIYLAMRYFTLRQQREYLWQRAFGTLSGRGDAWRRTLKAVTGMVQLPDTVKQVSRATREARGMLERYPEIANLP
jgi:GT2 family glycosyltransferase